jgi:hypothetical protein
MGGVRTEIRRFRKSEIEISLIPTTFSLSTIHQKSVAYHLREGSHDLIGFDWDKIMDFALLQFK